VIKEDGMDLPEIKSLFVSKKGNQIQSDHLLSFEEVDARIWSLGADIFLPGAASKLVTRSQVDTMIKSGLEVIACGANVPFVDDEVFFGPTARFADQQISLIPDFIANCGMARVFAYLMQPEAQMTDEAIFGDVSATIEKALREIYQFHPDTHGISAAALEMALTKLIPADMSVPG
jgi:glutamate dehydrogenase/leucine dehydrogenase